MSQFDYKDHFIKVSGQYLLGGAEGYTFNIADAGLFTKSVAESYKSQRDDVAIYSLAECFDELCAYVDIALENLDNLRFLKKEAEKAVFREELKTRSDKVVKLDDYR